MSFFKRVRGTFFKNSGVQDEIEFHIEQRAADLVAEGHPKQDALLKARREFGNPAKWQEETRDADVFVTLENWIRDTRQSLRGLRQRPVFALTAIGSLAIGIGAIASLFSIADAVIWKPVALPDSHELYELQEAKRGDPVGGNGPRLKDWQTLSSFAAATGLYAESLVWRGAEGNQAVRCLRIYSGMMATAKPQLAIGRGFTSDEENGTEPVAIATQAFWRNRLHSSALDSIELSGKSYRIVGVFDAAVTYPDNIDLWVPAPVGIQKGTRAASYLDVLVRLRPDISISQANAELRLTSTRLAHEYPKTDANLTAYLIPLQENLSRDGRSSLFALLAVAACVLAMICVNVAALLLSRGSERERESALRAALGATAGSLIRLYLIEAILLAMAGGAIGIFLAVIFVDLLKQILPAGLPRLSDAAVDVRVLGFTLLVSLLAALLAGLTPAWLAARKTVLHDSARGSSARADRKRMRTVFVVVEIALSVVLVTTGFRLGQAFLELTARPTGFRINDVLTVTVPFPWTVKEERLHAFSARAIERFSTLPGVTKAALVDQYPLLGGTQDRDVRIQGITTATPIHAGFRVASPEYFEVVKARVVEGRMFGTGKQVEFVVNQAFARRYFTDGRPADAQRVCFGTSNVWYDVVGVVSDLRQDPAKSEATPELFTYYPNDYWPYLNFALETTTPAAVLAPMIREEVAKLDGTVIVKTIAPLREKLKESVKDTRVRSILVGASATLALLLMAIGVHGLIAGDVAARWREFGVRLALGATIPSLRMILIQKIAALSAIGLILGILAVVATSNLLATSFQGLPPLGVYTVLAVSAAVSAAALSAVLWPLYRIARIDPATALRHD